MRRLRDPLGGCPWDREQSYASIVPHTLEEAYEVADAIARGDMPELRDELGDLLFQVVFYARLGEEDGHFDFGDVVEAVVDKLVRRHPHVFGEEQVADAAAQTVAWEALKAEERASKAAQGVLDGVSLALPALTRANKLQKRAARVGFDWPEIGGVRAKLDEELAELDAERAPQSGAAPDAQRLHEELGDVLFSAVNLARHLRIDPEAALRDANDRFESRFRHMEAVAAKQGIDIHDSALDTLDGLWAQAKRDLARG
ncbi:MAG: nucleoside triphosphate pyrophosphohydrolase [Gammaproteobacteria bacterium]|nr:nucleoside triphosphate pyrophosphohydrolase [Gammaproteobacteria bacterium]MCP5137886.1 nucleoside triphosphate pyrophosphohydrolase [Gammaproteobacteria bacterium]